MLESIGLTDDEERAYLVLIERPGQTRAELASLIPGWSDARVTRTIRSLVSQGFATPLAGRPQKYAPIPPDVAVHSRSLQQIERVRKIQKLIPDLMDQYWRAHQRPAAAEFVEILADDMESSTRRARQLHNATRHKVRGFERPPHRWKPNTLEAGELDVLLEPDAAVERDGLTRGVHYQVVYDQVEVDDPARWPDLRDSVTAGEEARIFDGLPLKLVLFDDWAATTPLVDPEGEHAGLVVIHKSPLLSALSALFDAYWDRAVPLAIGSDLRPNAERESSHGSLDDELVALLAAGKTDTAIARSLGVSRSTVQRRVNELMARLGVRTRFQLGLQLGRQGGDGS